MSGRSLLKLLKHIVTQVEAQALLACRDAVLMEQQQLGGEHEGEGKRGEALAAVVFECDICFEPFNRGERVPRNLKECGHTFCAPAPAPSAALPSHWRGRATVLSQDSCA